MFCHIFAAQAGLNMATTLLIAFPTKNKSKKKEPVSCAWILGSQKTVTAPSIMFPPRFPGSDCAKEIGAIPWRTGAPAVPACASGLAPPLPSEEVNGIGIINQVILFIQHFALLIWRLTIVAICQFSRSGVEKN